MKLKRDKSDVLLFHALPTVFGVMAVIGAADALSHPGQGTPLAPLMIIGAIGSVVTAAISIVVASQAKNDLFLRLILIVINTVWILVIVGYFLKAFSTLYHLG